MVVIKKGTCMEGEHILLTLVNPNLKNVRDFSTLNNSRYFPVRPFLHFSSLSLDVINIFSYTHIHA